MLWCVFSSKVDIGQKQWKPYLDDHSGRHDFQIDLALSVMNYGIGLQWDDESDERPNYMRQDPFVPCDCNKCFLLEWNHHWHCTSTKEESKSYCGIQMRDAGHDATVCKDKG